VIAAAAWVCLLAPLGGALAIALAGNRLSRRGAGYLATASTAISFIAAIVAFAATLNRHASDRETVTTAFGWVETHALSFKLALLVDPLSLVMMLVVAGVGTLIVAYSIGYMDGDDEERRYFAYIAFFVDAASGRSGQLPDPARRLGPGRALFLPADRLLAQAPECGGRRQEGVRDERDR
jgi:NADH-quinone oxidoreductase subunit L